MSINARPAAVVGHRSVQTSALTGVVLATLSAATGLPWWVWAAWAGLSAVAVVQALRAGEPTP